jgi:hypothetical protein
MPAMQTPMPAVTPMHTPQAQYGATASLAGASATVGHGPVEIPRSRAPLIIAPIVAVLFLIGGGVALYVATRSPSTTQVSPASSGSALVSSTPAASLGKLEDPAAASSAPEKTAAPDAGPATTTTSKPTATTAKTTPPATPSAKPTVTATATATVTAPPVVPTPACVPRQYRDNEGIVRWTRCP